MMGAVGFDRSLDHRLQERRMTDRRMLICFVTACATMGAALYAHHSAAVYETTTIELKNATMTGLVWANPHTLLTFDVRAGDSVTVELFPARNGARVGRLAKVVFSDGRELLDSLFANPLASEQQQ
jgi:hypothetical protein